MGGILFGLFQVNSAPSTAYFDFFEYATFKYSLSYGIVILNSYTISKHADPNLPALWNSYIIKSIIIAYLNTITCISV